jgi:cold shock CspA family protein
MTGIIQYYLDAKGYGYIRVPESREEFYFRKKGLMEPVAKGDQVRFELKETKQGLIAINIQKQEA